ncbi:MAG TPA: HEAT repeat domain-containing protein [Actinomycetota bacterium]|nr:HEAT repeat domain-containing protein [Actinomycetota bacterium]
MTTWFCPACFEEVDAAAERCPACGEVLGPMDAATYEDKLIRALDHRLTDRRVMAARILGLMGSRKAVPRLATLAVEPRDPYLAAEAVTALGRIGGKEAAAVVRDLAERGGAVVKSAAIAASAGMEGATKSTSGHGPPAR